jgi:uncharacterized protein YkuJ
VVLLKIREEVVVMLEKRDPKTHQLKIIEPYFSAVKDGSKTFEVRKFDRDFQVGDVLCLTHYNPDTDTFGEALFKEITYMLDEHECVKEGYVILGMKDFVIPFSS